MIAKTPTPPGGAAGQVIHWLMAMGDTVGQRVAGTGPVGHPPEQRSEVRGEISAADINTPKGWPLCSTWRPPAEAMRLRPTTGLVRPGVDPRCRIPSGAVLPEGTQVLIYNVFNHRTGTASLRGSILPGEWVSGNAATDWSFNFMSHGPQVCPGYGMSVFLGQAVMAHLLSASELSLSGAWLSPSRSCPTVWTSSFQVGHRNVWVVGCDILRETAFAAPTVGLLTGNDHHDERAPQRALMGAGAIPSR